MFRDLVSKLRPFAPRPQLTFVPPVRPPTATNTVQLGKRPQRDEDEELKASGDDGSEKMRDEEVEEELTPGPSKRLRKENSFQDS